VSPRARHAAPLHIRARPAVGAQQTAPASVAGGPSRIGRASRRRPRRRAGLVTRPHRILAGRS
jgi:hypothetical protein